MIKHLNKQLTKLHLSLLVLMSLLIFQSVEAQRLWNFDGQNPFADSQGLNPLTCSSVRTSVDYCAGIKGKALRTDGYSVSLRTQVSSPCHSVSAWFALESLPTDTATFIGIKDKNGNAVSVSVDSYGKLMFEISGKISGKEVNTSVYAGCKVETFKWLHLLLDIETSTLYYNGKDVASFKGVVSDLVGPFQMFFCQGFKSRPLGMYDQSFINGVIDNVRLNVVSAEKVFLKDEVAKYVREIPDLSIPASRFMTDYNRPKYHLMPAANWTNESHGLIYFNGMYHVFDQKNASNINLKQINWGHFESKDLVSWTERKPVLSPDKSYDSLGIWSGCAFINDEGIPQIIYTGGSRRNSINAAFPQDSCLNVWQKFAHNPIVADCPSEFSRSDMRDPFVWKMDGHWYMVVGFGVTRDQEEHGTLLLYRSDDLRSWTYRGLFFGGNPQVDHTGIFWEMPIVIKMGDKYVLSVNRVPHRGIPAQTQYWVGDIQNERFVPDQQVPENLEVINRLLSPSVWQIADSQYVAMAIIPDEIREVPTYQQGWAHLFSLPRVWTLRNGKICQMPLPALKQLRDKESRIAKESLVRSKLIYDGKRQVEIDAVFYPQDASQFGFQLQTNGAKEKSFIYYDVKKQRLVADHTKSSLQMGIPLEIRTGNLHLPMNSPVRFHLFIDGSVIEGFVNDEYAFTSRFFPKNAENVQVQLHSKKGKTEAEVKVWTLNGAKMKTNF